MDKIEKALKKLTAKEREIVKQILSRLAKNNTKAFDIKKLKGREDVFRIRKGDMRIIYRLDRTDTAFILKIDRRNKSTYRF